jgi:hypothetical protein
MTGPGSFWQRLGIALGACVLCTACAEDPVRFNRLEFTDMSLPQGVAEFEARSITLSEGTAVSARVYAIDSERKRMGPLELDSQDPGILSVQPGPEQDVFIFVGASVGTTVIDIVIAGRARGQIAGEVIPQ